MPSSPSDNLHGDVGGSVALDHRIPTRCGSALPSPIRSVGNGSWPAPPSLQSERTRPLVVESGTGERGLPPPVATVPAAPLPPPSHHPQFLLPAPSPQPPQRPDLGSAVLPPPDPASRSFLNGPVLRLAPPPPPPPPRLGVPATAPELQLSALESPTPTPTRSAAAPPPSLEPGLVVPVSISLPDDEPLWLPLSWPLMPANVATVPAETAPPIPRRAMLAAAALMAIGGVLMIAVALFRLGDGGQVVVEEGTPGVRLTVPAAATPPEPELPGAPLGEASSDGPGALGPMPDDSLDGGAPVATGHDDHHHADPIVTEPGAPQPAEAVQEPTATPTTSEPAAEAPSGASAADGLPLGASAAVGSRYVVTVVAVDLDATDRIVAEEPTNVAPDAGRVYVMVTLEVENVGAEAGEPYFDLVVGAVDAGGEVYDDIECVVIAPDDMYDVGLVESGASAVGTFCLIVPAKVTATLDFFVEEHESSSETRAWWVLS